MRFSSFVNRTRRRHPIASQLRPGFTEFRWFRTLVAVGLGNSNRYQVSINEREDEIARGNLSHGFVEGVSRTVRIPLGRPEIPATKFMFVGLILIDPPVPHDEDDPVYLAPKQPDFGLACGWTRNRLFLPGDGCADLGGRRSVCHLLDFRVLTNKRPHFSGVEIRMTRLGRRSAVFKAPFFDLDKQPERAFCTVWIMLRHLE